MEYEVTIRHKSCLLKDAYLEWTTEAPTEHGWYWAKTKFGVYMFYLAESLGELYFESIGEEWNAAMEEYKITHWLGPLPEPRFEE